MLHFVDLMSPQAPIPLKTNTKEIQNQFKNSLINQILKVMSILLYPLLPLFNPMHKASFMV